MRCPFKPRFMDKMFNIYSFTDLTRIGDKIILEKTYVGYLNIYGYRFRLRLFMEKVK
jgi:hypothetical protein